MDTDSEESFYLKVAQRKLNEAYSIFQKNDSKTQYGRLFSTEYFRDNIFPFNGNLGKKCARGDIGNDIFVDVKQEDLQKGMASFNEMMNDDFENLADMYENSESKDKDDIEDSLEELIKYKPYLIGQFLKEQGSDPDTQMEYAKYLCKQNLDIYNSDEWFRVGEATVGAASLAVAGALAFTGVGTPISAALASASTGLMLGTGAMGIHKYDQGDLIENSAALRMTTSSSSEDYKTSVDDYSKLTDTARQLQNEGLVDIATAGVIPAAKMVRVGRNVINKSEKGTDIVQVLPRRNVSSGDDIVDSSYDVAKVTRELDSPLPKGAKSVVDDISDLPLNEARLKLKEMTKVSKLPSEVIEELTAKGRSLDDLSKSEASALIKKILGKTSEITRKDKKQLSHLFHPDKLNQKGFVHPELRDEIQIINNLFQIAL
jgi:hypothetical protein